MEEFLKSGDEVAWRTTKRFPVQPGAEWAGTPVECREEEKRFPHLLQDVPVELLLAVAQEFPNHLAAEALPLEQEVCHPDGGVRDEASGDQELDPFVWVSGREGQRHGEFALISQRLTPWLASVQPLVRA